MKRFIAFLLAAMMLFGGCSEKEFENKSLSFKGSDTLDVLVGETKTLTAILPDNGVETTLSVKSSSDVLSASITESGELCLIGNKAGECELTFTVSAEGYIPFEANYPVKVTLNKMKVLLSSDSENLLNSINLKRGESTEIKIKCSAEDAKITVESSDKPRLSVSGDNGKYKITANASCEAKLNINISAKGYEDYSAAIPVTVDKIAAELSLSNDSVSALTGNEAFVTCNYQSGGQITAFCDNNAVSLKVEGDKVIATSNTAGSYLITVKCEAIDFTPTEKQFTAVFSMPMLPFVAPQSLTLNSGSKAEFKLSGYPEGTAFTLSYSGKIAVEISGDKITVTAKAAGSDTLTIKASKEGYQSSYVSVPITIKAATAKTNSVFQDEIDEIIELTNKQRKKNGLSALTYVSDLDAACAIRAKECSQKWSHTRPDGRDWVTALYDTGVTFKTAGENLFSGNTDDPDTIVQAWMDSPGHRENILRPNFNGICIGVYQKSDEYFISQHFIER